MICEDHFEPKYFVNRKDRDCLTKDAVPTIYVKKLDNGTIEQIIVPFTGDFDDFCQDSENEDPAELNPGETLARNQARLEEIKTSVCRFCSQIKEVTVDMIKFENYNVNVSHFMNLMELTRDYDEYLSSVVCEECFYQIVTLETFRVKSKEAELRLLKELKQLNPQSNINAKGYEIIAAEATENIDDYDDSYEEQDVKDEGGGIQEEYLEHYETYEPMGENEQHYDEDNYGQLRVAYITEGDPNQTPITISHHQIIPATIEIKLESQEEKILKKKKWKTKKEEQVIYFPGNVRLCTDFLLILDRSF